MDIEELRSRQLPAYRHTYTHRDVILYHLGLGATLRDDPQLVYEGAPGGLRVLPTFAIVAAHPSNGSLPFSVVPGVNPAAGLHGEQVVELYGPLPSSGTLVTTPRLLDIRDKGEGKGTVVIGRMETCEEASGRLVAVNEFVTFLLGTGGFGTPWPPAPRLPAAASPDRPPQRPPDASATERLSADLATLYRLSGDYNALHIDARVAESVGYPHPILHGLCTLGVSVRMLLSMLGPGGGDPGRVKGIKARFSAHVFPGETLRVDMWHDGACKVVFAATVLNRPRTPAISSASVEFTEPPSRVSKL